MHPEIEKLIDLALADGQITEKERNVILKKAASFGVDLDEVEIILDGKIHQKISQETQKSQNIGNIKICPACGKHIQVLSVKCIACEHEFIGTSENKNLKKFNEEIKNFPRKKIELLKALSIPNDKENVVEFLSFFVGQVSIDNLLVDNIRYNDSLKQKSIEVINSARVYFQNDGNFQDFISEFELDLDYKFKTSSYFKQIGKRKFIKGVIFAMIALIICFGWFIILDQIVVDKKKLWIIILKIWPYWLFASIASLALSIYYSKDYKKYKNKFLFLEDYE